MAARTREGAAREGAAREGAAREGAPREGATRAGATRERAARPKPPRAGAAPRTGAKRTVMYYIRQLPQYLRLLSGLMTDRRVGIVDKLLVVGAMAYIIMPIDLIPDFIPFFGEIDDLYLLVLALQRLIANAGRAAVLDHWSGSPGDLADLNLRGALTAAAFFLPKSIRRRLRVIGRV